MTIEHIEAVWIDDGEGVTLATLMSLSGLAHSEVRALVEFGALAPLDPGADEWRFERRHLASVKAAGRLRRDFDLEPEGLALAFALLERIHDLESELRSLRARLPAR